jgi:hypothetical protein
MPDRHAPAAPARDCPGAPETAGPDGYGLGPLDSADAAFRAPLGFPRNSRHGYAFVSFDVPLQASGECGCTSRRLALAVSLRRQPTTGVSTA